jgi:hypothetical protein
MPTRFEGGDRGQVHWTCGLGSLNRGVTDGSLALANTASTTTFKSPEGLLSCNARELENAPL